MEGFSGIVRAGGSDGTGSTEDPRWQGRRHCCGGVCCVVFSGLNGGNPQESWVGVRQKLRKALITLRIGRALRSKASALKLSELFNYCVSPT